MINEILVHRWAPVIPLPLMSQEQKENELERIWKDMEQVEVEMQAYEEGRLVGNEEGYKEGYEEGYEEGYSAGLVSYQNIDQT